MNALRQLFIILVIGGVFGFLLYKLATTNKWPVIISPNSKAQVNNQTQTVVQEENAVIAVVDKTSPSVVAIGVNQRIINPFNPFSNPGDSQNNTIGTGFVVSADKGVIVTNRHVVSNPNMKYTVVSKTGKKYDITKIYRDPNLDLALVQVSGLDLPQLELGDSTKIKVGQTAIAIGNALGKFDNTVTTGIVSGVGRAVTAGDPFGGETEQLADLIQTDAAINPGNSGGPLLNSASQVIGVNVATTAGAQNIGFAVPINSVKAIVNEFVQNGKITRPFLGVRYQLVTRDVAIMNSLPQGAYIQEVVAGSPADSAGIKAGDIITKIDGQAIDSINKLSDLIQSKKVGDKINLNVWTDGKDRTISATLQETPEQ